MLIILLVKDEITAKTITGIVNILILISNIIQIFLLILTVNGIKRRELFGPTYGIVVSILMILNLNLLDIFVGVLYLGDNINIMNKMKEIKKEEQKNF